MATQPSPELHEALKRIFPVRGVRTAEALHVELALADDAQPFGENGLTIRLIVSDLGEGGALTIRDIKEQDVFFPDVEDARAIAFFEGWARVAARVLAECSKVDWLMPHDALPTDALKLVRAKTADDFEQALKAKSRLGRLLTSAGSGPD
jgi:hypothetical protein